MSSRKLLLLVAAYIASGMIIASDSVLAASPTRGCPSGTVCDRALGIALSPPPNWRLIPPGKFPPHTIGLYVPPTTALSYNIKLLIESDGTTRERNDTLAAVRAANTATRGYTNIRPPLVRIPVRFGGAPGIMILNLPGQPLPVVEIVLAHAGALYRIYAAGQSSLSSDQRRTLTSLHFIPRVGPFPPVNPAALRTPQQQPSRRVGFTVPAADIGTGAALDEQHVVYGLPSPRTHRPTCVSCGQKPFTNFRMQMYVRDYAVTPRTVLVTPARLLFTGPLGAQIALQSFHHHWLVYETYNSLTQWALFARNVRTGRQIELDSSQREGTGLLPHASSDGRTVVWQSWTKMGGKIVSAIRSYSLFSGQRRLLISGGSGPDYFYNFPNISGDRVVFARETPDGNSQIFIANMVTGRTRALTPPRQPNSEAAISGNVVVWMHGRITIGHTHGLVVANLATGSRVALPHSPTQLPRIAAGRYVVFATDSGRNGVQVYDAVTGRRWDVAGAAPAYRVEAGDRVVLFYRSDPCQSANFLCPSHIILVALQ